MCAQPATPPESPGFAADEPRRPPRQTITPIQWVGLAVLLLLFLWQAGLLRFDTPGGITGFLQDSAPRLIALVLAITVHEFSHGLVATLFGDPTPRENHRLTLNPIRHLDPIGTLMIVLRAPIGWGKPMPINPYRMRNPNLGWALSSLAGPVSNIVAASLLVLVIAYSGLSLGRGAAPYIQAFITINVLLAIFNLLPIPPLDGFGFIFGLSPRPIKLALLPVQRMGPLILLAFLFFPGARPVLDGFLSGGFHIVNSFFEALASGA